MEEVQENGAMQEDLVVESQKSRSNGPAKERRSGEEDSAKAGRSTRGAKVKAMETITGENQSGRR